MTESGYLTTVEAAAFLGVTERFIRRLVEKRRIRYYKMERLVRFKPVDLQEYADAGRVDPPGLDGRW